MDCPRRRVAAYAANTPLLFLALGAGTDLQLVWWTLHTLPDRKATLPGHSAVAVPYSCEQRPTNISNEAMSSTIFRQ
jgi:hypothetical protein